jgi:hypothetical protein
MRRLYLYRVHAILFAVCLALPVHAQFAQRGSINGIVTDPSGALAADVKVTLTDIQRNQTSVTTTDSSGHYFFSQLLIGSYRLVAEASGFKKSISEPIAVSEQANVRYDFPLTLGGATETVDVTDATPLLETERTSFAQTIDEVQVKNLPINGRNYTSLAALAPGISTTPRTNINPGGTYDVGATFSSGGVQYAAGGVSEGSRDNGYYVNGVNVNENYQSSISFQPSAEAISEVKIGVADFSAEYGRDLTNFNASTKSGTNMFHGHVFDYIENDIFNALNPFDKAEAALSAGSTIQKNALRRNQYGAGLGGPVYIPKLLDLRKKAFFFVNYERFPQIVHYPNGFDHVPSDAFRAGDFSELCQTGFAAGICNDRDPDTGNVTNQIYNPYTTSAVDPVTGLYSRQSVLNNRIDLATKPDGSPLLDPLSAKLFALYPHANVTAAPGSTNNYEFASLQGFASYHFDSRYDFAISSKDNIYVTFSKYHGTNDNSGGVFPQFISNIDDKAYLVTVNEAHIFSPHLTNEFIFATGNGALVTTDPGELSFLNSDANPLNSIFTNTGQEGNRGIFAINMFGYGTPGFNEYFRAANGSLQFSDNLNWVRGRHTMTMGFNYIRKSEEDFDNVRFINIGCGVGIYCDGGRQLYSSSGTDLGNLGGDAAADLAMGLTTDIHQRFEFTNASPFSPVELDVFPYYGAYINDKIQVRQNLTLSLGLRYDLPMPFYSPSKICCGVYEPTPDGGIVAIPGRAPGLPQHNLSATKTNFAPRFSFAYRATNSLVVRAGYGLYYDSGASQISNGLGSANSAVPGGYPSGDDLTAARIGLPDQQVAFHLSDAFQPSPSVSLGQFPVPTGEGQGYFGDGQLQTINVVDNKSLRLPYYHRYMLDVQKELSPKSSLTLTYLGSQGRNGWYYSNINVPAYQTGWADNSVFDAARPNNAGRFGDIYLQRAGLNSRYNAGVFKFEHRTSRGLQLLAHYTFGKTISERGLNGQFTSLGYNYPQNIIPTRGEATLSHRHRVLVSTVYEPKYAQHLPSRLRPVLGDWRVSAIATFESGDALTTENQNGVSANDFAGPDQLNVSGDPNLGHFDRSFSEYFNVNAFSVPAQGVRGDARPGIIRGPGQNNWDISIGKAFNFTERLHGDIRADMFNAFNHTQWTSVSTTYPFDPETGVPFGQIQGGREGRIIQLGAKIFF